MTLPLWTPAPIALGSLGYHARHSGRFVTLFNAFRPGATSGVERRAKDVRSIVGFGEMRVGVRACTQASACTVEEAERIKKENESARMDIQGPAVYRFVEGLESPKRWLAANVDRVLELYGDEHAITKDDVCLGMFASRSGILNFPNFNIYWCSCGNA